ncbi:MAG TPA: CcoQ/FixQ family Cbb3-type cytochrome c oxidase assembly chaperone [Leucothrix mucor]|uniref:CcoQ/FixQ family Cbb3-type cytochrome c oxidase assembly chaperone n=1 Tax=Leucothrix mucor TaxID=45248 RepID=A0A7V2T0R0_LEUMU|nr:CcoQ/FixQ family Cbb3-type cytochrome c oxidase assembly chaperone [Leucothrix mucor]
MYDIFMWFTDLGNSKIAALLIFFPIFIGIILYAYTNKDRSKRLESYKYIPFDDDQDETSNKEKVKNNG